MKHHSPSLAIMALASLLVAAPAHAQNLGTFRWQVQPFCNVVTVAIEQQGGAYLLTGFDDRCGGSAPRASVSGTAFINPDGSLGLGFTIAEPTGAGSTLAATVNTGTGSGTWKDSSGNSGPFAFTPGAVTGQPRPVRVDETWHEIGAAGEPAFRGSWQNGTPPYVCSVQNPGCPVYNTAGYYKDAQGVVHLKGSLTWTVSDTILFRLPPGYRASRALVFPAQSTLAGCPSSICRYVVYDGYVQLAFSGGINPSTYHFSIDGITFKADQ